MAAPRSRMTQLEQSALKADREFARPIGTGHTRRTQPMPTINQRLRQLEKTLQNIRPTRCPLCLDRQVWRSLLNGQRQLQPNDSVYDERWHCRRCGAAAPQINIVLAGLPCDIHGH